MGRPVSQQTQSKFAAKGPGFSYSTTYRNWKAAVLANQSGAAEVYAAEHKAKFAPKPARKPFEGKRPYRKKIHR